MHYKSDKSIYALALCYSLISLEKLTNTKKENNHYVVNIKRSSLLYDAFKTVKHQHVFWKHNNNNQQTVINKIENGMHMHI